MNLKIEEYEDEFEEKLKKWLKELKQNENEAVDSNDEEAPNNYEKLI